jgi:hypothetical protein
MTPAGENRNPPPCIQVSVLRFQPGNNFNLKFWNMIYNNTPD